VKAEDEEPYSLGIAQGANGKNGREVSASQLLFQLFVENVELVKNRSANDPPTAAAFPGMRRTPIRRSRSSAETTVCQFPLPLRSPRVPRPQPGSTGSSSGRWPSEAVAAAIRSAGTSPYSVVRGREGRPASSAMACRPWMERYEP